jgi:hypothetical protein
VPAELLSEAAIPGMTDIRTFAHRPSPAFHRDLIDSMKQWMGNPSADADAREQSVNILALSGGGAYGAFGAGVLNGWSQEGSRPAFNIVTGISTGALIAPLAFLGPTRDPTLRHLYTSLDTGDILGSWPRMIMNGTIDSLADSYKVAQLISQYCNRELLLEIARSHRQGRRLYVGTVNLDASRLVVWNMGAIALRDTPEALELFRQVLLASVSIPILFPPELFTVEARGGSYDELHADGGVVHQVFVDDRLFALREAARQAGWESIRNQRIFVIQNLPTEPAYDPVAPVVVDIAYKSIMALFSNQGLGDLYRIYAQSEHNGLEFNLIAPPPEFKPQKRDLFNHQDMLNLFKMGYDMGQSGVPWQTKPPGYP